MNEKEKQILKTLLEHNYSLNTGQIVKLSGLSWNTAKKYLEKFNSLNWIEKREAYKINKIWGEFDILYGLIMDLTDLNLSLHKKVTIQETIIEVISTQTPKSPESEKQISTMMKKIEELEQFQKHVLETVAKKQLPKETKPSDVMFG